MLSIYKAYKNMDKHTYSSALLDPALLGTGCSLAGIHILLHLLNYVLLLLHLLLVSFLDHLMPFVRRLAPAAGLVFLAFRLQKNIILLSIDAKKSP